MADAPAVAADAAVTDAEKSAAAANTVGQSLDQPNWIASTFAGIADMISRLLGTLIVLVLDTMIPIMQYQGFVSSPVVIAGWAIVRDVVNMFFVVILIVIAMGTIFGSSKFTWRQQVPKLMLFAILINFSKTLCGLMIDFAQVIMLTFANALKDIAGGNFIQLLGLGKMMSLSPNAESVRVGISSWELFAASAAAVIMMVWVLAIVIMLLFILVYRIVMLWILIVMAPLAWFTAAVPFDQAKSAYGEWWKNFVCYCTVGPVITFFLWLSLAVAGAGNIAANDSGFSSASPKEVGQNTADGLTAIFEWENLASFIIGMALLVAGMDAAAKVCAGAKGGVGKMVAATKGGGFINQFAGKQARKYGEKGGRWAGGKLKGGGSALIGGTGAAVMAWAGGQKFKDVIAPTRAGQAARAEGQRTFSKKARAAGFDRLGHSASKSADERQADLAKTMKEGADEEYKGASDETKMDELIAMSNGGGQSLMGAANMGLLAEALKNPKMREKLEASGALAKLAEKGDKGEPSQIDKLKQQLKGTKEYEAIEEFENGRPDLTKDSAGNYNFKGINSEDDLRKLDPTALAKLKDNRKFQDQLATFKTGTKDSSGKTLNGLEYLNEGHGSGKQVRAWKEGMTGVYEAMSPKMLEMVPVENLAPHANAGLVDRKSGLGGQMAKDKSKVVRARVFSDPGLSNKVNEKAFGAKYSPTGAMIGVDAGAVRAAVKKDSSAIKNVSNSDMAGDMADAVSKAYLDDHSMDNLLNQYLISSPDDRREMDSSTIANVLSSFDASASAASTPTAVAAAISSQKAKLIVQLEALEGGKSNMVTAINKQITDLSIREATLASIRSKSADQSREFALVQEDIIRMNLRLAQH